ncbi:hypothetical protein BDF19DRAFT_496221 [Syncephalis fuscata]|nr:hypothetical protein BDF19DRAFT_496221 [Syncephalis fuscata]
MNATQDFVRDDIDWRHNATRLWNVPLHPSGEILLYNFITAVPNDIHTTRTRLFTMYAQIVINMFIMSIFMPNLAKSIRMIANRPQFLSGWCCLVPALFGVGWLVYIFTYLFEKTCCREAVWFAFTASSFSSVSNSIIVLQKAYIVLLKNQWVVAVGILLILPQLGFILLGIKLTYVTMDNSGMCLAHYSSSVPLYWFGVTIPVNILFSGIFSYVAYQQYKAFGSEAWKRLARNGIQVMCLVVFCNIICAICVLFKVGNSYSQMFFVLDWCVTSTILVNHCSSVKNRKTPSETLNCSDNFNSQEDTQV